MCTLIVRHGLDDWCSTLIAANRDEFYDRAASGPMVLNETPRIVGGRDNLAGGTWLGLTSEGIFLGLTNQRSFGGRDDALLSRGELVIDALRAGTFEDIRRYLEQIDARAYNEFNLIFGDGNQACAAYGRRAARSVDLEPLGPGVHVLCNDRLGSPEFPKAGEARAAVESITRAPWPAVRSRLIEVLGDRSLPDPAGVPPLPPDAPFDSEVARLLQAICVKTPVYGTVSATVAALSPGRVQHYAYCDGPPDEGVFEDFTPLLRIGG